MRTNLPPCAPPQALGRPCIQVGPCAPCGLHPPGRPHRAGPPWLPAWVPTNAFSMLIPRNQPFGARPLQVVVPETRSTACRSTTRRGTHERTSRSLGRPVRNRAAAWCVGVPCGRPGEPAATPGTAPVPGRRTYAWGGTVPARDTAAASNGRLRTETHFRRTKRTRPGFVWIDADGREGRANLLPPAQPSLVPLATDGPGPSGARPVFFHRDRTLRRLVRPGSRNGFRAPPGRVRVAAHPCVTLHSGKPEFGTREAVSGLFFGSGGRRTRWYSPPPIGPEVGRFVV